MDRSRIKQTVGLTLAHSNPGDYRVALPGVDELRGVSPQRFPEPPITLHLAPESADFVGLIVTVGHGLHTSEFAVRCAPKTLRRSRDSGAEAPTTGEINTAVSFRLLRGRTYRRGLLWKRWSRRWCRSSETHDYYLLNILRAIEGSGLFQVHSTE